VTEPEAGGDTVSGAGPLPGGEPAPRPLVRVEVPALGPDGPMDGVALVVLDRPEVLNALSFGLLAELVAALEDLDIDDAVRAIVVTGAGDRAFAAGADIKEMADASPEWLADRGGFGRWDELRMIRKPIIAAVRGFALGGGCELALACDLVVAGEDAQFGQPEIRIGVMPGAGGTQRLTRAIGKARAMDLILTGRSIDAREAERLGLVTRVVPAEATIEVALSLAATIASMPPLAVHAAKAAVNRAYEVSLSEGLADERQAFFDLFATADQKEGMAAFVEKRLPRWTGR
jgi:enoyl-CoA hydratase